jgi:hypothetical protein
LIQESSKSRAHFASSKQAETKEVLFAFTEQGLAVIPSILNLQKAIQGNIEIMRALGQKQIEWHATSS